MRRKSRAEKLIWLALCAVLIVAVALGFVFARYTGSWEKDFELAIKPVSTDAILADNTSGTLFRSETRHIVFGQASAYESHIAALAATKTLVGSTEEDEIYSYYDAVTLTTYVLCDQVISFNPNSSGLFKNLTALQTVTLANYSTALVTDMSQMFYGCSALTTVYDKGAFDTAQVSADTDMFTGCINLVGGEGTRVYPAGSDTTTQPLGKQYARIDGENDLPGYFTGQTSFLKYYFRSNSLRPEAEGATYEVNGSDTWFTVANALDSAMVSTGKVDYTLTYYTSADGVTWQQSQTQTGSLPANTYTVQKYDLVPTTPYLKVVASTDSFLQEDISAVFRFVGYEYSKSYDYASGVIRLTLNTNAQGGSYNFNWLSGITPDNANPSGTFATAPVGPGSLTANLNENTVCEYLFFVTDPALLTTLESDPAQAQTLVTVQKQ